MHSNGVFHRDFKLQKVLTIWCPTCLGRLGRGFLKMGSHCCHTSMVPCFCSCSHPVANFWKDSLPVWAKPRPLLSLSSFLSHPQLCVYHCGPPEWLTAWESALSPVVWPAEPFQTQTYLYEGMELKLNVYTNTHTHTICIRQHWCEGVVHLLACHF